MEKFREAKSLLAEKDTSNRILFSKKFEEIVDDYNYCIENEVLSLPLLKRFIKERDDVLHMMRLHQLNLLNDVDFGDDIAIKALVESFKKKLGDRNRDLKCCENQIMNLENAILNTSSSPEYIKTLIKERDMWSSLKIRKIRKTTGINGFFFKINKLFFLGVKFHEYSHYLTSKILGVPHTTIESFDDSLDIIDVMRRFPENHDTIYDYDDGILGYVKHEKVHDYYKILFISYSPLIFGTIVATGLFYLAFTINNLLLSLFTFFMAISISVNALPSKVDEDAIGDSRKFKEIRTVKTYFKNVFDNKDFIILTFPLFYLVSIFRDRIYLTRGKTIYKFGGYIYPVFPIFVSFLIMYRFTFVIPIFILIFCLYTMYIIKKRIKE